MADRKDLVVPPLGESITEAVIGKWLKNVGDPVAADEPVVDLETDKVTVQLPAPCAGTLAEQRYKPGDTVRVGESVGQVEEGAGIRPAAAPEPAPARPEAVAAEPAAAPARPAATPARPAATPARPAAAPEPSESSDTDVEEAVLRRLTPSQRRAARLGETAPHAEQGRSVQPRVSMPEPEDEPAQPSVHEEVVSMSPLRRRIAERLVQAQRESASLTTFNEVDMSGIMALRKRHQDAFVSAHGIKLGFMSFFAKACAAACKLYPGLNAEIRGDSVVYKKHYDFGIAVSTERGLVVPVLRGVDRMSFADIEQGIAELAGKARDSKLTIDDLTGGTFTITNGGIFGSMLSTPLLNYPQTGIMGMHNIVNRPVAIGDRVEVRPIMYLALTYDHRVVDGREAVQFLVAVKERVEQPDKLMFEL